MNTHNIPRTSTRPPLLPPPPPKPHPNTERLEPRMLLTGVLANDLSDTSFAEPLTGDLVQDWVPYVPTPEQTRLLAHSVGDQTAVKLALCFDSPAYRVQDWGLVKQDGNSFFVDAKVEAWTGPIIQAILPTTLVHQYDLGKLDPNAKYHFTFQAWGKDVQTLFFSVPPQTPIVSITAQPLEIREPIASSDSPLVPSKVTVLRTGPTAQPLDVNLQLAGTATPAADYDIADAFTQTLPDPLQVQIPAGQASATFLLVPLQDDLMEGNETIVLKLAESTSYRIGSPASAMITIIDAPSPQLPVVAIKASDPLAKEPDPRTMGPLPSPADPGAFTVVRSGALDHPLMVTLFASGSADHSDYHIEPQYPVYTFAPLPPGQFLAYFPEGISTSTLNVIPHGDNLVEADESLVMNILKNSRYSVGTPDAARVLIQDATSDQWIPYLPTPEQTDLAVNTAQGLTTATVTLQFSSPGFAVRDWGQLRQSANQFLVDAKIEQYTGPVPMVVPPPVSHPYPLGSLPAGDYAFTFQTWGKTIQTLRFTVDAPTPALSIVAAKPVATEPVRGGPQPRLGLFNLNRTGPLDSDLIVQLTATGSATRSDDYLFGPFDIGPFTNPITAVIPAGHASVPIPVLAKADDLVEGIETVILTISPADLYHVTSSSSASVRILDTPSPFIRVRDPKGGPDQHISVSLPDESGKLDLAQNTLIVQLPDEQEFPTILTHIANLARIGRNGGPWTGSGITSSAAANNPNIGLAILPNLDSQQIRVQLAYYGDANGDATVNADDYFLIDSGFLTQQPGWHNGDFNYDGLINADDYFLIDSSYIAQFTPLPDDSLSTLAASALPNPDPDSILSQLFSTSPVLAP